MTNAYRKGYRGEKELEGALQETFPDYAEDISRVGMPEKDKITSGDVLCTNSDCIASNFHWENKNRERLNVRKALSKALKDSQNEFAALRVKKKRKEPFIALPQEDFLTLLQKLQNGAENKNK